MTKPGKLAATMAQSPYLTGRLTVRSVAQYVRTHPNKGPVPASAKLSYTPTLLLTPANVNTSAGRKYQYLTKCG